MKTCKFIIIVLMSLLSSNKLVTVVNANNWKMNHVKRFISSSSNRMPSILFHNKKVRSNKKNLYYACFTSHPSFQNHPLCHNRLHTFHNKHITNQRKMYLSQFTTTSNHHQPNNVSMGASSFQSSSNIRLFGTKRESTDGDDDNTLDSSVGKGGMIHIYNEQSTLPDLDLERLEQTVSDIRQIIGYETYDVSLVLCEDDEMQQVNLDSRNINAPTDILSFPFSDDIIEPGILEDPPFDIPDYYNLGDMIIDIPYVIRRCEEDQNLQNNDNLEEERGISGAMANIYDAETRIHMLLIHGMLHLVGYDHIEDDDYELMVTEEEAVLKKLNQLMKERGNKTLS